VGLSLYGPYVLAVEISAMLLMSALVGAYHVARSYLARGEEKASAMNGLQLPLEHVLIVAGLLFVCGLAGLMLRRNLLFMLMSLEVMLNAAALAFVAPAHTGSRRTAR
jgi:NADH:ubiquinone oxidoreductase subunit 6 (subunit J)